MNDSAAGHRLVALMAIALQAGLASLTGIPNQAVAKPASALCQGHGVSVETGFARAGARACSVSRTDGRIRVQVQIRPETNPINPSPWYSLRLVSVGSQPVDVVLDYGSYRHRYEPHVFSTSGTWTSVETQRVSTSPDGKMTQIRLDLSRGALLLAGQPYDPPVTITQFLDSKVASGVLARRVFGQSVAGIPLLAYKSRPAQPEGTLILLSRQHPPEIAGEWAFDAFVGTILGESEEARAFRARFGVLILPLMNPDGIARGHWRTNLGLIDLNRDWGPFTQPETKAAAELIRSVHSGARAIGMIDFHATNKDVIYAQPLSAALYPPGLTDSWLAEWSARLGGDAPDIDRSHNASNANSKTWGRITLGVAAVTYEVGDTTPRADAESRARLAAEILMQRALAMPNVQTSPQLEPAIP